MLRFDLVPAVGVFPVNPSYEVRTLDEAKAPRVPTIVGVDVVVGVFATTL